MKEISLTKEEREVVKIYREIPEDWKERAVNVFRVFTRNFSEEEDGER